MATKYGTADDPKARKQWDSACLRFDCKHRDASCKYCARFSEYEPKPKEGKGVTK